jgi:phage FluMu protein Com
MTYYTCQRCGVLLETGDRLAGQREACPNCRNNNQVPAGQTREQAEQLLTLTGAAAMAITGAILLLAGAALAGLGLAMRSLTVSAVGLVIGILGYVMRRYGSPAKEKPNRASKYCFGCQMTVPASKARPDWLLQLAATLGTCGAWLIPAVIWLACRRWRCERCGKPIIASATTRPCMASDTSEPVPALATVQHRTAPAAASNFGWSRGQQIGFILFMLFGLPLLRTMLESPGKSAKPSADASKAAVALLPQDGVYSQPQGTGGSYRDPMNGYFEAQPPAGWQIIEKRNRGTFTFGPESTQPGRTAPRSWIVFRKDEAEIGAIARESFSTIKQDFELVVKGYRERFGATVERSRFVTIDGAKGGEIVGSINGMHVLLVKFKKNGLDHAITMTCPLGEASKALPEFERFLRSYRGLAASTPSASAGPR